VLTMPAYVWEALLERLGKEDRAVFESTGQEVRV